MARRLEVEIVGDASSLQRALGNADGASSKFGRGLKSVAKAAGIAGAAIGAGLAVSAKIGFDEFVEGQKVAAQTNAVLKSTGGAANVTAAQIDKLAAAMLRKTGIDDETIKRGANLLLTFTNIRNEVGKGNDVFNQATKIVQDMSVALGQDTKASAIQLGKALNDPIKGITALTRVGVSFTDAQKEQIKSLVEAGDTMGAQKIILKELQKEFGGSAEAAGKTFAGQMNILKETFSNFAGEIVGRFAPALVDAANFALPLIMSGLDRLGSLINEHVAPRVKALADVAEENWPKIKAAAESVFNWVRDNVFPIIVSLKNIFTESVQRIAAVLKENEPELRRIWERVSAAMDLIWKVAGPLLRLFFVEVLPRAIDIVIPVLDKTTAAFAGIAGAVKDAAQWVHGLWDWLVKITSKIWNIVVSIDLPDLPGGTSWRDFLRGSPVGPIIPRARAAGGPVSAMTPYLVGERGPELFVPRSGGTIIPNRGGGATYVLNAPNYVGNRDELFREWQQAFARFQRSGGKL